MTPSNSADQLLEDTEAGYNPQPVEQPAQLLQSFLGKDNIAPLLEKEKVSLIGQEVTRGYDIDKASRSEWEKQTKTAMELALQVVKEKSFPWSRAANVKYPLITTAAIQFSARAYPAIISGAEIVKGDVHGPDPDGSKKDRAKRIGEHMSYQLLHEMQNWDEEIDKLLLQTAIIGCAFRKTYFNKSLGVNASELVSAKELVFNHAIPFHKLRRITHEIPLYKNDVIERIRSGLFEEVTLGMPEGEDEDGHYDFLEQHCWYDLDGDDYKEPYIVTVKKDTSEVLRIVPRFDKDGIYLNAQQKISKIEPIGYFTKFTFLPNPDGGSYDVGLGILLNPINETVNTVINQLLDAGTAAITGGGFIGSGLRLKSGVMRFSPGEYKPVDNTGGSIRDNVYQLQFPGPSPVLFQLLGMLIDAGKDISSVKDAMTGENQGANASPTTTLALIEQGQKVFSAIYKRIHRSLKEEFKKIYSLNKTYMNPEEYYSFMDETKPIYLQDYAGDPTDVSPMSDPNMVTDTQQLARADALMKFMGDTAFNQLELRKRYLTAIKEPNIDSLLVKEIPPPADPQKMIEQFNKQMQESKAAFDEHMKTFKEKSDLEKKSIEFEADKHIFDIERKVSIDRMEDKKNSMIAEIHNKADEIDMKQTKAADQAINEIKRITDGFINYLEKMNDPTEESTDQENKPDPIQLMSEMHQQAMLAMQEAISSIHASLQNKITTPDGGIYTGNEQEQTI